MSAAYAPQLQKREARINPTETALLFIDCQHYNCSREGGLYDKQKADVRGELVVAHAPQCQGFIGSAGCRTQSTRTGGS